MWYNKKKKNDNSYEILVDIKNNFTFLNIYYWTTGYIIIFDYVLFHSKIIIIRSYIFINYSYNYYCYNVMIIILVSNIYIGNNNYVYSLKNI